MEKLAWCLATKTINNIKIEVNEDKKKAKRKKNERTNERSKERNCTWGKMRKKNSRRRNRSNCSDNRASVAAMAAAAAATASVAATITAKQRQYSTKMREDKKGHAINAPSYCASVPNSYSTSHCMYTVTLFAIFLPKTFIFYISPTHHRALITK